MNSLSQLLFGPLKLPAPLSGDAPDGTAVMQPGAFAQSLSDARAALGTAVPGQAAGKEDPAAALPVPGASSDAMLEQPGASAGLQKPAVPGVAALSFTVEDPNSLPGVQPVAADPTLIGAVPPATLPGLPEPQTQPAPASELDATVTQPAAAATPANPPAMLSAEARGPWTLRQAVRATTTEGTGQGSPSGNGLPPLGPDGGKALPDLPPARFRPLPAAAGPDAAVAAGKASAAPPDAGAAADMVANAAERPRSSRLPGMSAPPAAAPAPTQSPAPAAAQAYPDQAAPRATAALPAALPAASSEATSPLAQEAAALARMAQERGALPEGRAQSVPGEVRLPGGAEMAQRAVGAADAGVAARSAPTPAQPNLQTQSQFPGAATASTAGMPQSGSSTLQASAAPAAASAATTATAAAPLTATPEGLAERTAAPGQPGEVARQLGAVELRAMDPTAQGAADARRPAGADLVNQGQPGLRQDIATQVDSGMVAAVIDRRTIAEAAGQRRGGEQQAAAGADSVDRSPSTGTEAAEQISRPQTARPVVPVLTARDMSALAERIEMLMHRRSGVANVNLTLSELGDVEISVRLESKQAHVQFLVQDAAARESLEAQLPRLRALLSEGGLELGDIGMNMRERSGSDNGGERGDHPPGTPRRTVTDSGGVEEPSPRRRSGGGDHVLDAFA